MSYSKEMKDAAIKLRTKTGLSAEATAKTLARQFPDAKIPTGASVLNWTKGLGSDMKEATPEEIYELNQSETIRKDEVRELKKEIKHLQREGNLNRMILKEFKEWQVPFKPVPVTIRSSESHTSQTLVAIFSDAHGSACVEYEQMHGINEYDESIWRRRQMHCAKVICDYINKYGAEKQITQLVIAHLGDNLQGSIHDADISNLSTQAQAVKTWSYIMTDCYNMILEECPQVEILSLHLSGNHTRRTIRQDVDRPLSHDDALTGMILEQVYRNEPRIRFLIPNSYWQPLIIENQVFIFTHGHQSP